MLHSRKLVYINEIVRCGSIRKAAALGVSLLVFLLGIPFSQLSGDHAGDVSRLKGEVEAVDTAQVKNKCKSV